MISDAGKMLRCALHDVFSTQLFIWEQPYLLKTDNQQLIPTGPGLNRQRLQGWPDVRHQVAGDEAGLAGFGGGQVAGVAVG